MVYYQFFLFVGICLFFVVFALTLRSSLTLLFNISRTVRNKFWFFSYCKGSFLHLEQNFFLSRKKHIRFTTIFQFCIDWCNAFFCHLLFEQLIVMISSITLKGSRASEIWCLLCVQRRIIPENSKLLCFQVDYKCHGMLICKLVSDNLCNSRNAIINSVPLVQVMPGIILDKASRTMIVGGSVLIYKRSKCNR